MLSSTIGIVAIAPTEDRIGLDNYVVVHAVLNSDPVAITPVHCYQLSQIDLLRFRLFIECFQQIRI